MHFVVSCRQYESVSFLQFVLRRFIAHSKCFGIFHEPGSGLLQNATLGMSAFIMSFSEECLALHCKGKICTRLGDMQVHAFPS